MEAFPFTEVEWAPVKDTALSILNADSAGDHVLKASQRLEMLDLLAALRERHGDHPALLETMADYLEDAAERTTLYRQAVDLAVANGLPTLSIRQSFARLLVDVGESAAALAELRACGTEVPDANVEERARWAELLEAAAYDAVGEADRAALYRQAMDIAAAHGQPTLSLRLALVRFLLDAGATAAALAELRACEGEVPGANEDERTLWARLLEEADQAA